MSNPELWGAMERSVARTFSVMRLPTEKINGFLDGCAEAAYMIDQVRPDVVFVPMRGASVLNTAIRRISYQTGLYYPTSWPLLVGNRVSPFNFRDLLVAQKPRKLARIEHDLLQFASVHPYGVHDVMVLDEKKLGASSLLTSAGVYDTLVQIYGESFSGAVHLLAMEYGTSIRDLYNKFIQGEHPGVIPHVVKAPNPFVDKPAFLDAIIEPTDAQQESSDVEMLVHVHNHEAARLLELLVDLRSRRFAGYHALHTVLGVDTGQEMNYEQMHISSEIQQGLRQILTTIGADRWSEFIDRLLPITFDNG